MNEQRERFAAMLWAVVALALLLAHVTGRSKGKR